MFVLQITLNLRQILQIDFLAPFGHRKLILWFGGSGWHPILDCPLNNKGGQPHGSPTNRLEPPASLQLEPDAEFFLTFSFRMYSRKIVGK